MENLGLDYKLLIAQVINFGLFFLLFKKFIAKPFLNLIKEEEENEKKNELLKSKLLKQDEEIEIKRNSFKDELDEKEDKLITSAKERAKSVELKIIDEAEVDAKRIKQDALLEIESEKQDLYKQLKNKISELSLIIVDKSLKEVLNEDTKKKITSAIIKNLPKDTSLYEN
ncbi:MAG: hypothetical protein Q8P65_01050 [bacterium]|nr:hypothetical protein [bacterium]